MALWYFRAKHFAADHFAAGLFSGAGAEVAAVVVLRGGSSRPRRGKTLRVAGRLSPKKLRELQEKVHEKRRQIWKRTTAEAKPSKSYVDPAVLAEQIAAEVAAIERQIIRDDVKISQLSVRALANQLAAERRDEEDAILTLLLAA